MPDLFGLSTPEVYPNIPSPDCSVSSYLTFSPLLRLRAAVLFSVALSVTGRTGTFPLGSRSPCVARTFLSIRSMKRQANSRMKKNDFSGGKDNDLTLHFQFTTSAPVSPSTENFGYLYAAYAVSYRKISVVDDCLPPGRRILRFHAVS
jgi:hypothetical protein